MILFALLACGGAVVIEPGQGGCTDVDLNDPEASSLTVALGEDSAVVTRTYVMLTSGLAFDPTIQAEDGVVSVYEAWAETDEATEDPFCYAPTVTLTGGSGDAQVRWYLAEGDTTPFDTVEVEL